jgi:hypothetical protein
MIYLSKTVFSMVMFNSYVKLPEGMELKTMENSAVDFPEDIAGIAEIHEFLMLIKDD